MRDDAEQHRRLAAHRGSRLRAAAASRRTTATAPTRRRIDNDGTKATLEFLHDLRWEDNSLGSQLPARLGQHQPGVRRRQHRHVHRRAPTSTPPSCATSRMNPDDYGLTVVPIEDGGGMLGGGDIAVVSPTVDDATKAAAVTWIDWYYMQKLLNEDAAVPDAKTLADSDQAVGTPVLPVLDQETYEESLRVDRAVHQRAARPDDAASSTASSTRRRWASRRARRSRSTPCSTPSCRPCSPTRTPTSTPCSTKADVDAQALLDE